MSGIFSQLNHRTYIISSCNNLSEVVANRKTAKEVLSVFCTVVGDRDYDNSSLIKVKNHLISDTLLVKVLARTISSDISLTLQEERALQPYQQQLRKITSCE